LKYKEISQGSEGTVYAYNRAGYSVFIPQAGDTTEHQRTQIATQFTSLTDTAHAWSCTHLARM